MTNWKVTMSYMISLGANVDITFEVEAADAVGAVEAAKAEAKKSGAFSSYRLMFSTAAPIPTA